MAGGILLKNLLETVGLIILSMGGAGAIIMSVSSFLANKIATRLEQKYKLRIDKELEAYKAGLTQRSYVTKVQFDIEFEVYRKLSKGMFEFISTLYTTIEEKHFYAKRTIGRMRHINGQLPEKYGGSSTAVYENADGALLKALVNGFLPGMILYSFPRNTTAPFSLTSVSMTLTIRCWAKASFSTM